MKNRLAKGDVRGGISPFFNDENDKLNQTVVDRYIKMVYIGFENKTLSYSEWWSQKGL